jgi:hypothetical protein
MKRTLIILYNNRAHAEEDDENKREKKKYKTERKPSSAEMALQQTFLNIYKESNMPWLPNELIPSLLLLLSTTLDNPEGSRLAEYLRLVAILSSCNKASWDIYSKFISSSQFEELLEQIYKESQLYFYRSASLRENRRRALPHFFRIATINEDVYHRAESVSQKLDFQNTLSQKINLPTHFGIGKISDMSKAFQFDKIEKIISNPNWRNNYHSVSYLRLFVLLHDIQYFYNSRCFYRLCVSKKLDYRSVIVLGKQKAKTDCIHTHFFDGANLKAYRIVPFYNKEEGLNISRITRYQEKIKNKDKEKCYSTTKIYTIKRLQPNDRALDVRWRETDNIYDIIKYHEETIRQWKNLMRRCDAIKKDPVTVIDVT